jgi:hypothetical protein
MQYYSKESEARLTSFSVPAVTAGSDREHVSTNETDRKANISMTTKAVDTKADREPTNRHTQQLQRKHNESGNETDHRIG